MPTQNLATQLKNLKIATRSRKVETSISLTQSIAIAKDKQRAAMILQRVLIRINSKG